MASAFGIFIDHLEVESSEVNGCVFPKARNLPKFCRQRTVVACQTCDPKLHDSRITLCPGGPGNGAGALLQDVPRLSLGEIHDDIRSFSRGQSDLANFNRFFQQPSIGADLIERLARIEGERVGARYVYFHIADGQCIWSAPGTAEV